MAATQLPPVFLTTASSILDNGRKVVERLGRLQDELVKTVTPSAATFSNVMLPLAHMDNEFRLEANMLGFYSSVSEDKDLREASTRAQALLNDFEADTYLRQDIFQLVNAVCQLKENLDSESAMLLKRTVDKYIQSGIAIKGPEQRERFKTIQGRLGQIRAEFCKNISDDLDFICFTLEELDGVPESILSRLDKAEQEGSFKVFLADPGDTAMKSFAKADTRKRLLNACQTRCSENIPLLNEAVVLRREAAHLLGFPNHAALRLQERMVKAAATVEEFLGDLREKLSPGELDALTALNAIKESNLENEKERGKSAEGIKPWDIDLCRRLLMEQQLSINGKRIMEYFPVQTTIPRMLQQYSVLFGLQFKEITGKEKTANITWHEDVQVFSVYDDEADGGRFLGYLYLDLFHRPGKYPQASCFSLQPGFTKEDGTRHYPVTALLCDFAKPAPKKPSLMRHFDVVTTFHELGHGIHDLVCKTKFARLHGPQAATVDFGEMPSQMLEQWCWQPSQMKYLSCHYSHLDEDMRQVWELENHGAPRLEAEMDDGTIEGIVRSRRLNFGPLFFLDQLLRGAFDLAINQVSDLEEAEALDLTATWTKLRKDFQQIARQESNGDGAALGHEYTTHTHLVSGDYEAGYYVYLLSQVYAADLFYSHFQGDIMDSKFGRKFRQTILEKSGSQDEMQSIVSFLGRDPSSKAFNEHLVGL